MPPKMVAKGKKGTGDKKAAAATEAKAAAAAVAAAPATPSPEEFAALRAAKEELAGKLEKAAKQLERAAAERRGLEARVAALEAQGQKDAAIIRDMTRQYVMTRWSATSMHAMGV